MAGYRPAESAASAITRRLAVTQGIVSSVRILSPAFDRTSFGRRVMAPGPWYEVVPVSIETQRPVQQKAPASSDPTITVIVFVCAILIGSSSGILIADREGSLGQKVKAAAQSVGRLTSLPSKSDPGAGKSGSRAPETSKESKPAARPSNKALQSEASSLGDIHYSEQPDSASVDVEMESAVLVRTEKVHSPERIYFDLRDSRQQEGPMDKFRTKRAVPHQRNAGGQSPRVGVGVRRRPARPGSGTPLRLYV